MLTQLAILADIVDGTIPLPGRLPPGMHFATTPLAVARPLTFLFPGQGSQFPDMLRDVAVEFAEVAECFENADRVSRETARRSAALSSRRRGLTNSIARDADRLKATEIAQPALGACDAAMLRLLGSFGIEPALAAGHSYGELVALHAAGCFDQATLFRLSAARGRAMAATTTGGVEDPGTMMAVRSAKKTLEAIAGNRAVSIANHNSPLQTVISGTTAGIEQAAQQLERSGLTGQKIPSRGHFIHS